jgi:hypothetical protein
MNTVWAYKPCSITLRRWEFLTPLKPTHCAVRLCYSDAGVNAGTDAIKASFWQCKSQSWFSLFVE